MLPTQRRIFSFGFCKCKNFSLIFCLIYVFIICRRISEQWKSIRSGRNFRERLFKLVSQLTKPRFQRSLVICPRTSTNCQHSRNENLGFLTINLVVHSISFRILKISFVVKGNESNNYALLVKYKPLFKPNIRLQYFFWYFFILARKIYFSTMV